MQMKTVEIPSNAGDPSFDPQFPKPIEWYIPTTIRMNVGDTVTWINNNNNNNNDNDTTPHTVTSGKGINRYEGIAGKSGIVSSWYIR